MVERAGPGGEGDVIDHFQLRPLIIISVNSMRLLKDRISVI